VLVGQSKVKEKEMHPVLPREKRLPREEEVIIEGSPLEFLEGSPSVPPGEKKEKKKAVF